MSFFSNLFGNGESTSQYTFWKDLKTENDLNEAIAESHHKKVVIFKHSNRCFISKGVLKNFEKEVGESDKDVSYYFLDLIAYRGLSNKIAEDLDVVHQSPQIIVLENGKVVKHASHESISLSLV